MTPHLLQAIPATGTSSSLSPSSASTTTSSSAATTATGTSVNSTKESSTMSPPPIGLEPYRQQFSQGTSLSLFLHDILTIATLSPERSSRFMKAYRIYNLLRSDLPPQHQQLLLSQSGGGGGAGRSGSGMAPTTTAATASAQQLQLFQSILRDPFVMTRMIKAIYDAVLDLAKTRDGTRHNNDPKNDNTFADETNSSTMIDSPEELERKQAINNVIQSMIYLAFEIYADLRCVGPIRSSVANSMIPTTPTTMVRTSNHNKSSSYGTVGNGSGVFGRFFGSSKPAAAATTTTTPPPPPPSEVPKMDDTVVVMASGSLSSLQITTTTTPSPPATEMLEKSSTKPLPPSKLSIPPPSMMTVQSTTAFQDLNPTLQPNPQARTLNPGIYLALLHLALEMPTTSMTTTTNEVSEPTTTTTTTTTTTGVVSSPLIPSPVVRTSKRSLSIGSRKSIDATISAAAVTPLSVPEQNAKMAQQVVKTIVADMTLPGRGTATGPELDRHLAAALQVFHDLKMVKVCEVKKSKKGRGGGGGSKSEATTTSIDENKEQLTEVVMEPPECEFHGWMYRSQDYVQLHRTPSLTNSLPEDVDSTKLGVDDGSRTSGGGGGGGMEDVGDQDEKENEDHDNDNDMNDVHDDQAAFFLDELDAYLKQSLVAARQNASRMPPVPPSPCAPGRKATKEKEQEDIEQDKGTCNDHYYWNKFHSNDFELSRIQFSRMRVRMLCRHVSKVL